MSDISTGGCTVISLAELEESGSLEELSRGSDCPFVLPFWLRLWHTFFGSGAEPLPVRVEEAGRTIGIAPLQVREKSAAFLGGEDVLDYQDMLVRPGRERPFFGRLLRFLGAAGLERLELGALRPDSVVMRFLPACLEALGYRCRRHAAGRLYSLEMPSSWQEYLALLDGRQRHEIRRKFRRLEEAGSFCYTEDLDGRLEDWLGVFFTSFRSSSAAKEAFLSEVMAAYFQGLAEALQERGMLRPGTLLLAGEPIATTFGFSYKKNYFLYNNGYLSSYSRLSPGQLCKVMSLRRRLLEKNSCYNFLKGDEAYKGRLGGRPTELYRLEVDLVSPGEA